MTGVIGVQCERCEAPLVANVAWVAEQRATGQPVLCYTCEHPQCPPVRIVVQPCYLCGSPVAPQWIAQDAPQAVFCKQCLAREDVEQVAAEILAREEC